jgi:hypothetical protein
MGYLCGVFAGGELYYPRDPAARALVDQRLYFDIGILYRSELKGRDDISLLMVGKNSYKLVWIESTLPMQLTDCPLVVWELLFIGRTQISLAKSGFNLPSEIESPRRLWSQRRIQHGILDSFIDM